MPVQNTLAGYEDRDADICQSRIVHGIGIWEGLTGPTGLDVMYDTAMTERDGLVQGNRYVGVGDGARMGRITQRGRALSYRDGIVGKDVELDGRTWEGVEAPDGIVGRKSVDSSIEVGRRRLHCSGDNYGTR